MTETAVAPEAVTSDGHAAWVHVLDLLCELSIVLPMPGFKLGDLLRLQDKSIVDSHWAIGSDVPVRVNGELIAWSEFEVVGENLAVRITELA
jgi:flagellar motor switch/type III secretory pathway protein FliN